MISVGLRRDLAYFPLLAAAGQIIRLIMRSGEMIQAGFDALPVHWNTAEVEKLPSTTSTLPALRSKVDVDDLRPGTAVGGWRACLAGREFRAFPMHLFANPFEEPIHLLFAEPQPSPEAGPYPERGSAKNEVQQPRQKLGSAVSERISGIEHLPDEFAPIAVPCR